jgi:hypothetical protein
MPSHFRASVQVESSFAMAGESQAEAKERLAACAQLIETAILRLLAPLGAGAVTVSFGVTAPPKPRRRRVAVPTQWGMFTSLGNQLIQRAARAAAPGMAPRQTDQCRRVAAEGFLRAWLALETRSEAKGARGRAYPFREATDTAVRESVLAFLRDSVGDELTDEAWATVYDAHREKAG